MNRNQYKLILMENKSHAPLLTDDQPIINTHANLKKDQQEVEQLEFYYPVPPQIANLLTDNKENQNCTSSNL